MYRKIKPLLIALLLPVFATAQLEADNWVFGSLKYINFNKATQPSTINLTSSQAPFGTGTTTYSDKNGQLLFYSDGVGLHNRNLDLSPATNPLIYTNGIPGHFLSGPGWPFCQTVLAVPYPAHDSLFILFHINYNYNNSYGQTQLLYSIINMNSDSGRGDVDRVQRNIPVFGGDTSVLFKLTAVLHCNKKDIWLVGHLANSDKYFCKLITATGIGAGATFSSGDYIPVYFGIDSVGHPSFDGAIKVAPSGNRVAASFKGLNFIELSDFNIQTGVISGLKKITAAPPLSDTVYNSTIFHRRFYGPVGLEFSSSGDRLYTSSNYDVVDPSVGFGNEHITCFLYQFDASLGTAALVQNSKYFIDSTFNARGGAIQLANNGKIYANIEDNLCEIASPENIGSACNYTRYAVPSGGQAGSWGLPIFLQSYLRYPIITTGNCQFQNIDFTIQNPSGISSIAWDFGDPVSGINNTSTSFITTHIFSTQGIYQVKAVLQNANGCGADTISKIINAGPFKVFLGKDTSICNGDTLQLHMNIPNATNHWNTGSLDTVIKVTQPGTYWLRVDLGDCYASDTIVVSFSNLPQFSLGNDTVICNSTSITLSPNVNYPGSAYLWSTNANTASITTGFAGEYWLKVTDNNGCKWQDTVKISFKTLTGYSLGNDTAICKNDTLQLNATVNGANNYLWNTGAVTPIIKVSQSAIYWCDVSKDGCTFRDSLILNVKALPLVSLGNDITLCEDQTLLLDATNNNATYLWQDASTNAAYLVKQQGQYRVKVIMNSCITRDTINVAYNLKPKFSLGPDNRICMGSIIVLDPKITGVSYLWQDGTTTITYKVTQPGLYSLTATNSCGPTTDEIIIGNGICNLYVPNSFTPNGDTKNDLFKAFYGENVTEFHMQVYNRYGQLVFQTRDKQQGWDGTYKGTKQSSGAYAWIIQYRTVVNDTLQKLQGTVLLLR